MTMILIVTRMHRIVPDTAFCYERDLDRVLQQPEYNPVYDMMEHDFDRPMSATLQEFDEDNFVILPPREASSIGRRFYDPEWQCSHRNDPNDTKGITLRTFRDPRSIGGIACKTAKRRLQRSLAS